MAELGPVESGGQCLAFVSFFNNHSSLITITKRLMRLPLKEVVFLAIFFGRNALNKLRASAC